jgi:hypothetical protein
MGTSALHVVVERTALASKLAESRDPVALRRAAAEELAAARWGDRVVRDLLKSGRAVEAIEEQKRNQTEPRACALPAISGGTDRRRGAGPAVSIVTVIVLAVLSIGAFVALLAQGLFHARSRARAATRGGGGGARGAADDRATHARRLSERQLPLRGSTAFRRVVIEAKPTCSQCRSAMRIKAFVEGVVPAREPEENGADWRLP